MQFSLRSLLLVTTLAAVGCWWFLQPPTREEELAGKHLKLRRQVKLVPRERGVAVGNVTVERDDLMAISVGSWRLIDEHGDPLVVGRYQNDVPHGNWTVYHVNGRKAAEGQVVRGARHGLWRVWDAEGRLQSEVTYLAVERKAETSGRVRPWVTGPIPVVGMIGPLGQLGGGLVGGSGKGMGGGMMMGNFIVPPKPLPQVVSERHGPAHVWHPTGKLKFEGPYIHDRKVGRWTYYDEQGRITTQGEYCQDQKEGIWIEISGTKALEVEYVGGRPREVHDQLIAQLRASLIEGDGETPRHERMASYIAAAERLETLGRNGVPLLLEVLDQPDADLRVLAIRALESIVTRTADDEPSHPLPTTEIVAKVAPLTTAADARLRTHALLVAYRLQPAERERLLPKLLEAIQAASDAEWQVHAFATIFNLEPQRQAAAFPALAHAAAPMLELNYPAALSPSPDFVELAAELNDLPTLLNAQAKSHDPVVRRFVLAVVGHLSYLQPPEQVGQPGSKTFQVRYPIPEPYRDFVERLKNDPDSAVREAAQNGGKPQGGPGQMIGGSMF